MINHERQLQQAFALLKEGKDWQQGFNLFESREVQKLTFELGVKTPLSRAPLWRPGMDVGGRHIVLLPEQGIGDTIMFARFIDLLKQLPIASVSMSVSRNIAPLLGSLGLTNVMHGECNVPAMKVKIMSLPTLLLQYNSFPHLSKPKKVHGSKGYFNVGDVEKTDKIGFCWYTENTSWNAVAKKIPIDLAKEFYDKLSKKRSVVSLQMQQDFMPRYLDSDSWLDTAKKVKALDAIVTVDTAVAHLAGALGVRTINLIGEERYAGWFYYPVKSAKTPWYDSMELIWYEPYTNWKAGLDEALKKLCR
jgi:hypothetical protein